MIHAIVAARLNAGFHPGFWWSPALPVAWSQSRSATSLVAAATSGYRSISRRSGADYVSFTGLIGGYVFRDSQAASTTRTELSGAPVAVDDDPDTGRPDVAPAVMSGINHGPRRA